MRNMVVVLFRYGTGMLQSGGRQKGHGGVKFPNRHKGRIMVLL